MKRPMSDRLEKEIINNLILARELGHLGPRWNRAFRRELWRRLGSHAVSEPEHQFRLRKSGK